MTTLNKYGSLVPGVVERLFDLSFSCDLRGSVNVDVDRKGSGCWITVPFYKSHIEARIP